jgi:protoporphyrinogen oxidase
MLGQPVKRIRIESSNRVVVETAAGARDFDDVFITLPEPQARSLLDSGVSAAAFQPEVPYLGMLSIACSGDWSLSDHAITYHTDRDVPYSGIVEMTRLVPTIDMAGRHLMFLMRFTGADDAYQMLDDKEVAQRFFSGLEKMYDEETRDGIREYWVFREPAFRPVPELGITMQGEPALRPAPGISCLNTRLLHFGAADGDGAVRLGRQVADQLTAAYDPSRYADDGKGDWRQA